MVQMLRQSIAPNSDQMNWSMQYFRYQRMRPAHKWSIDILWFELRKKIHNQKKKKKKEKILQTLPFIFESKKMCLRLLSINISYKRMKKDTQIKARLKSTDSIDRSVSICSICC